MEEATADPALRLTAGDERERSSVNTIDFRSEFSDAIWS
jgi:hypothetical protein